jgi:hypothetical protein
MPWGSSGRIIGGYAENDVFISPKPYPSWSLNRTNWLWEPPIPRPTTGCNSNGCDDICINTVWNEENQSWDPMEIVTTPYPEDGNIYIWDIAKQEWVIE